MELIMNLRKVLTEVFTNLISKVLVIFHFILLLYVYWERQDRLELPFHYHYESSLFKTLYEIDFPSLWLTGIITYPLYYDGSPFENDWGIGVVKVTVLIVCTSLQWALVGYVLWKAWKLANLSYKTE
jgi:hypothetical protein